MTKQTPPQEVIFGIHPILELLRAKKRKLYALYTTRPEPKQWQEIEKLLPKHVAVNFVPRDALTKMAGTTDHQSVVGFAGLLPRRKKFFDPAREPFILMLDGIQDTRNLGAILRSAYCTGVTGIIMTQKKSAPLTAATYKAAAGLAEHLDIYEASSAQAAVAELKKAGYNIYLAALGGKSASTITFSQPLCLVIGNEAVGITPAILSEGTKVMLPQRTPTISYNASVAAGILLYLIGEQQKFIS